MPLVTTAFSFSSAVPLLIERPQLPLAVYLEIAAHLRQVDGIAVDLLSQAASEFDYLQSQVGGLKIDYQHVSIADRDRIAGILNYYEQCYGTWNILSH